MIHKPELILPVPMVRLAGRVEKLQILEKGIIVKEFDGFDNLVLDQGLNMAAANYYASLFGACAVGTGNAVPAVGQTTLQAQAASTFTKLTGAGNCGTTFPNPYTFVMKRTFDFVEGSLGGNYTELGFGPTSGANMPLFSRLLIQVSGAPAPITVTAAQRLRVVYTLTVTFGPIVDTPFNINFGGSWGAVTGVAKMQNIQAQAIRVDTGGDPAGQGSSLEPRSPGVMFISSSATALASVGSAVNRSSANSSTQNASASPYVAGTFTRQKSITFTVNQGNGPVQSFGLGAESAAFSDGETGFACVMDAPKTKLGTNTLTLNFQISWGR